MCHEWCPQFDYIFESEKLIISIFPCKCRDHSFSLLNTVFHCAGSATFPSCWCETSASEWTRSVQISNFKHQSAIEKFTAFNIKSICTYISQGQYLINFPWGLDATIKCNIEGSLFKVLYKKNVTRESKWINIYSFCPDNLGNPFQNWTEHICLQEILIPYRFIIHGVAM